MLQNAVGWATGTASNLLWQSAEAWGPGLTHDYHVQTGQLNKSKETLQLWFGILTATVDSM